MSEFVEIGFLKKSFGVEGQLRYTLFDQYESDFIRKEFIFLDIGGSIVPFFVTEVDVDKSILKLEWVTDLEEANKFASRSIYMKEDQLPASIQKPESKFQNFELFDKEENLVGIIRSIEEFPGQEMIIVEKESKDYLIPFHENLIIQIDQKSIIYDIPEGVMDL